MVVADGIWRGGTCSFMFHLAQTSIGAIRIETLQVALLLPQVLPLLNYCYVIVMENGSQAFGLFLSRSLTQSLSFFPFFWPMTHISILKHCTDDLCWLLERSRLLHLFTKCQAFIRHQAIREAFPAIKNQFQPNQTHLGVSQRTAFQHGNGSIRDCSVTGQKLSYNDLKIHGSQQRDPTEERLHKIRKLAVVPSQAALESTWQESVGQLES